MKLTSKVHFNRAKDYSKTISLKQNDERIK